MANETALYVILALLAAWFIATLFFVVFVIGMLLTFRPWDGSVQRNYSWTANCPYAAFWLGTWISNVAGYVQALKPAPLRATELAISYVQSHVIFALVNLKIPDLLLSGPKSAADLAAEIGPSVDHSRLARLLNFAAAHGMIIRKRSRAQRTAGQYAEAVAAVSNVIRTSTDSKHQHELIEALLQKTQDENGAAEPGKPPDTSSSAATTSESSTHLAATPGDEPDYLYSLNAVSACLCSASPSCVAHVVKAFEDQCGGFQHLSEGLLTGQVPFQLFSGGQDYWQYIDQHPRRAYTFDMAMAQTTQPAGPTITTAHCFTKYQVVVDVGGGVGGLLVDVLKGHDRLRGILFDRPQQIQLARELWSRVDPYQSLSARVDLVGGDVFNPESIPPPPQRVTGRADRVGYMMRNILHDWPDAECLKILRNIRQRIPDSDVSRVRLLIIEATSMERPCSSIYKYRLCSDLLMLSAFGDAKERSKQQFEALLTATGWKLTSIKPTNGLYPIIEAQPVCMLCR